MCHLIVINNMYLKKFIKDNDQSIVEKQWHLWCWACPEEIVDSDQTPFRILHVDRSQTLSTQGT